MSYARACAVAIVALREKLVRGVTETVMPGLEGTVRAGVAVSLEVIHHQGLERIKTPYAACPHGRHFAVVDFIHTPVVGLAQLKVQRGQIQTVGLCRDRGSRAFDHVIHIGANMHVVLTSLATGSPRGHGIWRDIDRAVCGNRRACLRRNLEELHFAEAVGHDEPTPVALDIQTKVFRRSPGQIHSIILVIAHGARSPTELIGVGQHVPGHAVHRDFGDHILHAPADGTFRRTVGVPDLHHVQFFDLVKFELDPGIQVHRSGKPHGARLHAMHVIRVQARPVDHLLGSRELIALTRGRHNNGVT